MYLSDPYFWREAGISTANFFVRYVSDLQAIFHTYFAGSPNWEGDCTSLPGRVNAVYEGTTIGDTIYKTKNNQMDEQGEAYDDLEVPWYDRHWIHKDAVKPGENGKSTASWYNSCGIRCQKSDVPTIIYPTPLCLSMEAKLSAGPEDLVQHRKLPVAANEKRHRAGTNMDVQYKADFFAKSSIPEGIVSGRNTGFLLAFDKTCNVQWGQNTEKYWECEKVHLSNMFVGKFYRNVKLKFHPGIKT